jgi:hypothetical protein
MTMRKCLALACLVLISSSMAFQIPARLPRLAPAGENLCVCARVVVHVFKAMCVSTRLVFASV